MQVELLEWNFWHGVELQLWQGFSGRAGLGLKFFKILQACIQNFFVTLRVTTFFFRSIDLLCSPH